MSKHIAIQARPKKPPDADAWVGDKTRRKAEKSKRLTIDIDAELHTRLRIHCFNNGTAIADVLRRLIAEEVDGVN